MCSGFSAELTIPKFKAAGIGNLLNKPILKQEMAVSVRELLDSQNGGQLYKIPVGLDALDSCSHSPSPQ